MKQSIENSKDSKPILLLNEEFIQMVNSCHMLFPEEQEWSGILVFKVNKGDISNPKDMEMEAISLVPMDIGNSTFTEYETDERIFDVIDTYPQLDPVSDKFDRSFMTGHIHSHHKMKTYFSQVDLGEVMNNADKYLFYLSLIVNYSGRYVAKIVVPGTVTTITTKTTKMSGRQNATISSKEETTKVIVDMDCDIVVKPTSNKWLTDNIDNCINLLEDKKKKATTTMTSHGVYYDEDVIPTTVKSGEYVPEIVTTRVMPKLSDLISIGVSNEIAPLGTLHQISTILNPVDLKDYENAFINYFDIWMDKLPPSISRREALLAVRRFFNFHSKTWLVQTKLLSLLDLMIESHEVQRN